MTSHTYRTESVTVAGGQLCVGVWEPNGETPHTILAIHGVTSSHLAFAHLVRELPGVRIIAPDLRGRGRSNTVAGAAGMAAHADDMAAVLTAFECPASVVVGHSMGAFVAVALAHRYPEHVSRLVLVDGGLPLEVPDGMDPAALVAHILGPTAQRLTMRFADTEAYFDFWRAHPAFSDDWTGELEEYFSYDLVDDAAGALRPATRYEVVVDDTVDLDSGDTTALDALAVPTVFVSVPRGLQNQTPGLYTPDHLADMLARFPRVRHVALDDLNHYTVLLSRSGAAWVAEIVRAERDAESSTRA